MRKGMSFLLLVGLLLGAGLVGASSCAGMSPEPGGPPAATMENNPAFHARLLELGRTYESFARVDDELHWAPFLCRQPAPSQPRRSMSPSEETHGRKLYYVFARDRLAYLGREGKNPAAVGQAVIKEAWEVTEVPADTPFSTAESPVRYLKQDGRLYHASQRAGLFIMYRLDPATPDTDQGWVYGTVSVPGSASGSGALAVTSSGRVQACMGCHVQAPSERLFGIQYGGL